MKKIAFFILIVSIIFQSKQLKAHLYETNEDLPGEHVGCSLTKSEDGKKSYLFGGYRYGFSSDLFVYNKETNKWSLETPENQGPDGRMNHMAAVAGGKLYVFSGDTDDQSYRNDLWSYDFTTKKWTQLDIPGMAPPSRSQGTMVNINGKLYLFAGQSDIGALNDLWCYNPESNTWNLLTTSFVKPRRGHKAVVAGGKMYVSWGVDDSTGEGIIQDMLRYDPLSNSWTVINTSSLFKDINNDNITARYNHAMIAWGSQLFVMGGLDEDDNELGETWKYDANSDKWEKMTDNIVFHNGSAVAFDHNNNSIMVLICGGISGLDTLDVEHVYFNIAASSGLDDHIFEKDTFVYPSVTAGIINIRAGENLKCIELLNCSGQVIDKFHTSMNEFSIDLANNVQGIYLIRLVYKDNTYSVRKIILVKS